MRVLIVDDWPMVRTTLRAVLQSLGMADVDEAGNGPEALRKLRTGTYDLVISDWDMPGMSGLDLTQEIRRDAHLKNTPVVIITGNVGANAAPAAMEAGANLCLAKPVSNTRLKHELESLVGPLR
jgi:two-component system chemotaxis response regulator CheY